MNKVLHINVGGYPFTIDEDAYHHLDQYLSAIDGRFKRSEGYDEIVHDIEARLAELLQERLEERQIVSSRDVDAVIKIMGRPESFGATTIEEEEVAETTHRYSSHAKRSFQPGKRLFRNPEEEVIGGVCAGLAAYLGVQDPIWIRLAFVLAAFLGFGSPAIVYIIMWAIIPKAKTAGDRLAMRGEPVNIDNIGRIIEEEIEHFSDKIEEMSEDWTCSKKKVR